MANKYRFQYVPSSGALPGADFEDQTERAFNEIGTLADEAVSKAETAIDIANSAQKEATEAVIIANGADKKAQQAIDAAAKAQTTADKGVSDAKRAQDTADKAVSDAAKAQTTANQGVADAAKAQGAADKAQKRADDAFDKATNALSAATSAGGKADALVTDLDAVKKSVATAQSTADAAKVAADSAVSQIGQLTEYQKQTGVVDLSDVSYFARLYVANIGSRNLPVAKAGFLDADIDNADNYVLQRYRTLDNDCYLRVGTITTSGKNETTTWGKWIKIIHNGDTVIKNITNMFDENGKIKDGYLSQSVLNSINQYVSNNVINIGGSGGNNPLQSYIDAGDFLNFPPKIGFFDENTVPIFSAFNMNYMGRTIRGFWCVSDSLGREVMYFYANNGKDAPTKLYRATRLNDNDKFSYENNPVHPAYMGDNDYPVSCFGLGTDYIFYNCKFGGRDARHLVKTNGSSVYGKWNSYVDVTSITTGGEMGVFYFADYDTIALVTHEVQSKLRLYRAADLSLIKEVALMNIKDALTIDDPTKVEVTSGPSTHFGGGAVYIKNLEILVTYYDISYWFKNLQTEISYHHYPPTTQIYHIPLSWFQSGAGTITEKIPRDQYRLKESGFYGDGHGGRGTVSICGVYDEYEETLRTQTGGWDDINTYLRRVDVNTQPLTSGFGFTNVENTVNAITPDGSPWSKWMRNPILYGNTMFLHCVSAKYGDRIVKVKYRKDTKNANYIEVIPGQWELTDGVNWMGTMCQRVNASTTKWHIARHNYCLQEVVFDDDGNRSYVDTAYIAPAFPADKDCVSTFGYDLNKNVIYYIAKHKTSPDPAYQNYPFLLTYTKSNNTWTTYDDPALYPDSWNDRFRETFNFNKTYGYGTTQSNLFIDLDGSAYATIYFSRTDWQVTGLYKFVISNGTLACTYMRDLGWGWGDQMISYDKTFGYVLNLRNWDQPRGRIDSSKDYYGGGTEKSAADFWSGQFYSTFIGLASASGLVAYSQETPLFLGGYYSVVPAQEIVLAPEQDNYVYLVRNRSNRQQVDIIVRDKMFGVKGETAFNRLLATRIKTNAADAIEQEYYPLTGWNS